MERKAGEALTRERKAGMLGGIEDLGAKKQEGLDSVEQLMQSKAEKNKAMESIRYVSPNYVLFLIMFLLYFYLFIFIFAHSFSNMRYKLQITRFQADSGREERRNQQS